VEEIGSYLATTIDFKLSVNSTLMISLVFDCYSCMQLLLSGPFTEIKRESF
jgi:hypothetical protein